MVGSCCMACLKGPIQPPFLHSAAHSCSTCQLQRCRQIWIWPGTRAGPGDRLQGRQRETEEPCRPSHHALSSAHLLGSLQLRSRLHCAHQGRTSPRLQSAAKGTEQRIQSQCLQRLLSNKECFREAELLQRSCYASKQAVCTATVHPRAGWPLHAPSRSDLGEIPAGRWGQSTQEGAELTVLSLGSGSPLWTLCKVVTCVLRP